MRDQYGCDFVRVVSEDRTLLHEFNLMDTARMSAPGALDEVERQLLAAEVWLDEHQQQVGSQLERVRHLRAEFSKKPSNTGEVTS